MTASFFFKGKQLQMNFVLNPVGITETSSSKNTCKAEAFGWETPGPWSLFLLRYYLGCSQTALQLRCWNISGMFLRLGDFKDASSETLGIYFPSKAVTRLINYTLDLNSCPLQVPKIYSRSTSWSLALCAVVITQLLTESRTPWEKPWRNWAYNETLLPFTPV